MLSDGQNDDLNGGDLGGQNQSVIIAVGHDHRADHPGRAAPGGLEGVLLLVVPAGKGNVVGTAELVAEVVGGRALKRLVIFHHALHGVGRFGAGELLLLGLLAGHHRDGQNIFKEIGQNSRERRKGRVVFSQRMTEHHWLYSMGSCR